jgi:hypothetical protein
MSPSQAMPPHSAAQAHRGRLAAELNALNARFGHDSVSLGEVVDVLGENTYTLLVLLLALPFVTPVSLFGLSTAFGAAIAYFGIRLACGLQPRFPDRFRARRLPPRFFGTLLRAAEQVIRRLERCTRPRLASLTAGGLAHRTIGGAIVVAAGLLALPLPVPFTNTFPALAILCLATGLIEDDGGMVLAGFGFLLLSALYFGLLYFVGFEVYDHMRDWFISWFAP